uniref:DUAL SPECIFICITY PROTEIN PHOSPHATASE 6 n=1 Tax=Homo sapiens TaxID=9606 RepID=UPI0000113081|nr:Chain A, DUAL SPECIFICITY PROTEIN PHOSPHATASE 6 [Homo sapiens]
MIDTLRPVPFASEMAISKTVAWLNEQLELGNERLLLMDCRPQELYESSHIESAINVAIPGIMLRRLQKGNLPVRALFTRGEDRDRFTRRCGTDTVVLYDESSSDWNENTGGESLLGLLLKKLKDEGCRAFYLEGGFSKFQAEFSLHCETNLDGS